MHLHQQPWKETVAAVCCSVASLALAADDVSPAAPLAWVIIASLLGSAAGFDVVAPVAPGASRLWQSRWYCSSVRRRVRRFCIDKVQLEKALHKTQ